jgi:hypothetical protein
MISIKKILFLAALALVFCTCSAMADPGVPQVPETQGFSTSTVMSAAGTVTETDNIVHIIVNRANPESGQIPYPIPLEHADISILEYTSTYSENTIADQGLVTYTKAMTTDTSGMATSNLYNVQTDKVVEFIGSETGRMLSDESTVLDGAGTALLDETIMICPFASPEENLNPDFCNIVREGSSVDLTLGSLATGSEQRYIMKSAGYPTYFYGLQSELPVSDPGVESNYNIKLTGLGDIPAMGSAESTIDVHVQEGRLLGSPVIPPYHQKAEDLVYSETTTASGDITVFQKVLGYSSKITAPGQPLFPL